jgi:hypothetical protein
VKYRIEMEAHLTLAARDSLQLAPGKEVWLVIKTHSCHLMKKLQSPPQKTASSEKSVGHRYAPMGTGSSARAAREPDVG